MADIFISYAREDETRIRDLVRALEGQGWSIFWDRRIPAGKSWQSYIGQALSDAKCVIVAWSHHSVTSDWVIEEANVAKKRGVIVPVRLDAVDPPFGFTSIQAADLTDWKPGDSSSHFDQLIQDMAGVVGGKPHRPTPEEELTARTQPVAIPGAVPTEPGKKRNNFLIGAIIALVLAIVAGLALWIFWLRPVEHPVAKAPEVPPKAQGVSKPEEKPPEPEALQPKTVSKPAEKSPERQVSQPKTAAKAPTQRTFTSNIGMGFVLIPAGSFTMGSPTGESGREPDELQHPVTISKPFYLQTTEVTQKQWTQVMGSNPSYFKDCGDDCPVETVSWNDAQEFIKKLIQTESGAKYRLPTEAEWEYACRAGSKGRFYFGDVETKLGEYAWYQGNSGWKTHPVRKREPNAWGFYDMHGNVLEWCQDWYGDYTTSQVTDPTGPKAGQFRVLRGGSWNTGAGFERSAYRDRRRPDGRYYYLGFRIARDP